VNILICDDHVLFCEGLRELILKEISKAQVFITNALDEIAPILEKEDIQVFICDINFKLANGIEWMLRHNHLISDKRVIILTGQYDDYTMRQASKTSMDYFLRKEVMKEELIAAILGELEPTSFFGIKLQAQEKQIRLSKQEKTIVRLITEGLMSKEIADRLFISKSTVDTHRRNINRKLGVNGTAELLKKVYDGSIEV
jgi:DNA-binding NarL/FixJ family response regulator